MLSARGDPGRDLFGRQDRNGPETGFVVRDSVGGASGIGVGAAVWVGAWEVRTLRWLEKGKAEGGPTIGLEPAPAEGSAGWRTAPGWYTLSRLQA